MATLDKRCVIGRKIEIGCDGENNACRMIFNIKQYLDRWPGTTPRMMVQRAGDFAPCYVETEMLDENTIAWTITRYDTARRGMGKMWIEFVDEMDDVLGLTDEETPVLVRRGPNMVDPDTPVPMLPAWMQKIVALIGEIPARVNAAIQTAVESGALKGAQGDPGPMGMRGPAGPPGSPGKDGDTPRITLTRNDDGLMVGVLTGDVGESQIIYDGYSPKASVKRTVGGAVITLEDKDSTETATVYDGASGVGIAEITVTEVTE